jgi:hypothetical protein
MWCRKTAGRAWWGPELLAAALLGTATAHALEYRENFQHPGQPVAPPGYRWHYRAELAPATDWQQIVPGDGFAYLSVRRSWLERQPRNRSSWPFQTITFGPLEPGHRLTMRARDAAIPGVASMIFTHREDETLDEIDIEIAAADAEGTAPGHLTGAAGGWTDVRLNTYAAADTATLLPARTLKMPIVDASGKRTSHQDGRFHTYAIEWRTNSVRFLVDGVEQAVITAVVPQRPANLIVGLRQMPWAGRAEWNGYRTMLVDWVAIEPLDDESTAATPADN